MSVEKTKYQCRRANEQTLSIFNSMVNKNLLLYSPHPTHPPPSPFFVFALFGSQSDSKMFPKVMNVLCMWIQCKFYNKCLSVVSCISSECTEASVLGSAVWLPYLPWLKNTYPLNLSSMMLLTTSWFWNIKWKFQNHTQTYVIYKYMASFLLSFLLVST